MHSGPASTSMPIYIMIGTRAQFIKVAPLLRKLCDKGVGYTLIYTAQHHENIAEILAIYDVPGPDIILYHHREANTKGSFLRWFADILFKALFRAKQYIPAPGLLLTHGDTFTAWLAALMGRRAGCQVGHIESGCRSYNLFSPFPEELSRLLTFRLTEIFFCADEWAINNLRPYKGLKINMGANTMLDGVRFALSRTPDPAFDFEPGTFGIVSIHRFENIFTERFPRLILPLLREIALRQRLVFILHPATRERLAALGLLDGQGFPPNLILHQRLGFIDWINACNKARFVITDGGSNQEELSYLGVPTLLFRRETERREGLGKNAVLSRFDSQIIHDFVEAPERYRTQPDLGQAEPCERILEIICGGQTNVGRAV